MNFADYLVLFIYFSGMAAIGIWAMRQVKAQEDYFMGGRKFGKLFQTFAAFGAGTGSADPVNTARGTFACLLYTSPSPRDATLSRMPSSA